MLPGVSFISTILIWTTEQQHDFVSNIILTSNTVDGFIFVGTNFRGLIKNDIFVGLKYVAIVFSFIIHRENYHFVGTRIRGSDPPRKPRKLVPHEI